MRLKANGIGRLSLITLTLVIMVETASAQQLQAESATLDDQAARSFCQDEPSTIKIIRAQLEQSYITLGGGWGMSDALIFESRIASNLIIDCPRKNFVFVISPKIIVRMFNEPSAPVRTPSYMPRATLYIWRGKGLEPKDLTFNFLSLTVSHHSNGQNGPFFTPDGKNNHENGSFSTNYIDLAVHSAMPGESHLVFGRASIQIHPGIGEDEELKGNYGRVRLNFSVSGIFPFGSSEGKPDMLGGGSLELTYLADDVKDRESVISRMIASLTYTLAPESLRDIGFFINFYYGQDYYNIRFDDTLKVIRVGLIVNFNAMAQ